MGIKKFMLKTFKKLRSLFSLQNQDSNYFLDAGEYIRIKGISRFIPGKTRLFGKEFRFVDSVTFISSFEEIFNENIYKFNSKSHQPLIIDCGANIGLATIYFKRSYPNARIIAFEPDSNIFNVLKENTINQGYKEDVQVRNEALSNCEGYINFYLEGGHSGMIVKDEISGKTARIKSTRLKDVLNQYESITFLKLDVEGYEKYIIPDIKHELKKVEFMFLEYHSFLNDYQNLDEILGIIKDAGFRYYIKESFNKKCPFINREIFLSMDLLVNIFCYRTD